MFLKRQEKTNIDYYAKMLKTIGSLSRLFSESNEPYIQYRIAENLFCKSFKADNLSRTDCSADASKDKLGVGIKTFLEKNGATMQKVAEFNSEHGLFNHLKPEEKTLKIVKCLACGFERKTGKKNVKKAVREYLNNRER